MQFDDTVKIQQKGDWWDASRSLEQFTLTLPSDMVTGEDARLIVEARDQFGFTLEDFTGQVHIESDVPANGLPETIDFAPEDHGVIHIESLDPEQARILRITAKHGGDDFESNPAQVHSSAPERRIFFGDIHCHIRERRAQATVNPYDEAMGPSNCEEFYRFARDTVGLDFCALTDHDVHLTDREWEDTLRAARDFRAPGEFVTFPGYEWGFSRNLSKLYGHRHVIYRDEDPPIFRATDNRYQTADDLRGALREAVGEDGAIVCPHHPARGDLWLDWREVDDSIERLVEIYSLWGSAEHYGEPYRYGYVCNGGGGYHGIDEAMGHHVQDGLEAGHRFGIIAGSECHDGRAGRALVHGHHLSSEIGGSPAGIMAVHAKDLSRESLWEAMHNRRTHATTGVRIRLHFSVNNAPMGAETDCRETNTVRAEVHGTEDLAVAEILRDNEAVHAVNPDVPDAQMEWEDDQSHPGAWYYLRVTQTDGNVAWSSPVWMT